MSAPAATRPTAESEPPDWDAPDLEAELAHRAPTTHEALSELASAATTIARNRWLARRVLLGWLAPGIPGALLLGLAFAAALGTVALLTGREQPGRQTVSGVSALALRDIPHEYLRLYQAAGRTHHVPWQALAGVGKIETDHGRSSAPGVRSGVNRHGCCAGPMQFNIRNGPPSTWTLYGRDDHDGRADPYDPADAVPAAARYLHALGAQRDLRAALYGYNHSSAYVEEVLAWARRYRGPLTTTIDAGSDLNVPAGPRLARLIALATEIEQRRIPYCYGGGHVTPATPTAGSYCWNADERKIYGSTEPGLDCSSSVSLLLQRVGYQLPTLTSGELARWGDPGPGRHVTIWANPGHVYLQIDDRHWGTSATNHRHGPGWHPARPPTGYTPRHPPAL